MDLLADKSFYFSNLVDLRSAHRSKVDEVALLRQQCRDDEHKISQLRSQIQVLESQVCCSDFVLA